MSFFAIRAVSYTHLDVYKRQGLYCFDPLCPPSFISSKSAGLCLPTKGSSPLFLILSITLKKMCIRDRPDTVSQRNQLRNLISDLRQTFKKVGLKDVIVKSWNILSMDPGTVDCDYYGFLGSDPVCVNSYTGEYMTQYSWAEMTMGFLYSQND